MRRLSLLSLLIVLSGGAVAEDHSGSFCRGFMVGALAENGVEGPARIDLWLGWNATVAMTQGDQSLNDAEYQEGRQKFDSDFAARGLGALETREGECDMGRTSWWVWW